MQTSHRLEPTEQFIAHATRVCRRFSIWLSDSFGTIAVRETDPMRVKRRIRKYRTILRPPHRVAGTRQVPIIPSANETIIMII